MINHIYVNYEDDFFIKIIFISDNKSIIFEHNRFLLIETISNITDEYKEFNFNRTQDGNFEIAEIREIEDLDWFLILLNNNDFIRISIVEFDGNFRQDISLHKYSVNDNYYQLIADSYYKSTNVVMFQT